MATVEKPDELKIFRDAAKSASEGSRVFIEINGCRVAIGPPEDAEYMDALEDAQDIRDAEKAMEELNDTISINDVMKEYGMI